MHVFCAFFTWKHKNMHIFIYCLHFSAFFYPPPLPPLHHNGSEPIECVADNITSSPLQKELRILSQRQEFVQLLVHCEEKCGGKKLPELLKLPAERVSNRIHSELRAVF